MKNLHLCFLVMLMVGLSSNAQCITNGGFENGTAGYVFKHRAQNFAVADCSVNTGDASFSTVTLSGLNDQFSVAAGTLVSQGADPFLLTCNPPVNILRVAAGSGTRALKLNRSTGGSDITTMSQTFTASGTDISFNYSLIIQNPHKENMPVQPFFSVRVYDILGNIISSNNICIMADIDNPIFDVTQWYNAVEMEDEEVLYTGWKCGRVRVPSEFINQTVRVEFIMADCGLSGHFGTVYLDDITCNAACSAPSFGIVEMNNVNHDCPEGPFEVCGSYVLPEEGTLTAANMTLNITQNGTIIKTISGASSFTTNSFCFTVNPATDFGINPSGDFEFRANANFLIDGTYVLQVSDLSSSTLADVSIHAVEIMDANVVGSTLTWPDVAEVYELEFFTDGSCCPGTLPGNPVYFHFTQTENTFNLNQIASTNLTKAQTYGCYRWRIRTECGWSPWCCITIQSGNYDFPPGANWGNPLSPDCYNGPASACASTLYVTNTVLANTVTYEQRDQWIKAVNIIQVDAVAIYQAGDYIELLPGFNSLNKSLFQASINECVVGATAPQPRIENEFFVSKERDDSKVSVNNSFVVYPNPFVNTITIIDNTDMYSFIDVITVIDIDGKEVLRMINSDKLKRIDLNASSLNSGIYFILGDGKLLQKVIKN